jgi:hypothetical protein
VYEVPSTGHFFREMVDYPNISQVMEKTIPNIYSMFRTFAAIPSIFLQSIPFGSFCTLFALFYLLNHKAMMPRRYYSCFAITPADAETQL